MYKFQVNITEEEKNQQYLALVGAFGGTFIGAFVVAFIGAIIGAGVEDRVSSTDRFTRPPFTVKTKQRVHL